MAPEPRSAREAFVFDPNGPGMGLDVDFNNFDLGDIDPINVQATGKAFVFDPNGPGIGLDINLNNFDLGNIDPINVQATGNFGFDNLNVGFNNFDLGGPRLDIDNIGGLNFDDVLKEPELSLGPHETLQAVNTSSPNHLPPPKLATEKFDVPTLAEASSSNIVTSTHQEPVHSNEMRAQKRKKPDEVDKGQILPEGLRRNQNKTARALGLV